MPRHWYTQASDLPPAQAAESTANGVRASVRTTVREEQLAAQSLQRAIDQLEYAQEQEMSKATVQKRRRDAQERRRRLHEAQEQAAAAFQEAGIDSPPPLPHPELPKPPETDQDRRQPGLELELDTPPFPPPAPPTGAAPARRKPAEPAYGPRLL